MADGASLFNQDLFLAAPLRQPGRLSSSLAWLGGAQRAVLSRCPSETMRFAALGLAVVMTGIFGGTAAALATSYFLHRPAMSLWPVGLAWGIAITNIDRLLIMMAGSWRRLLISIPLRLALAIPVGLLIAEILLLAIFEPEENAIIAGWQQTRVVLEVGRIESFYQPKIEAAGAAAAQEKQSLAAREAKIEQNRFLSGCESSDVRCSTTHRLGCEVYCQHYARLAQVEQVRLSADRPSINRRITAAHEEANRLDRQRLTAEDEVRARVAAGGGLGAHKRALDQLQAQDGGVRLLVTLLRISLILLDLMPVLLKAVFVLLGTSLYDKTAAAVQGVEGVNAYLLQKLAWFRKRSADRHFEAADEVDEARVDADREQRINDVYGADGQAAWSDWSRTPGSEGRSERKYGVPATTLSEFIGRVRTHEHAFVPIDPALTRAAWIGTGLIALLTTVLAIISLNAHALVGGTWIAVAVLVPALTLAGYTRGFRRAPGWAQRAAFGIALTGFILPPLILTLNF